MVISGCNAIIGEPIDKEKISLLKENQATKSEIIKLLGMPDHDIPGKNGKGEYLIYYYSKSEMASFKDKEKQTVTLYIDDNNILRNIKIEEKLKK
jgi:outer membrane protein assembly factor BamE (lipoprotein component of BamABCDE complex)